MISYNQLLNKIEEVYSISNILPRNTLNYNHYEFPLDLRSFEILSITPQFNISKFNQLDFLVNVYISLINHSHPQEEESDSIFYKKMAFLINDNEITLNFDNKIQLSVTLNDKNILCLFGYPVDLNSNNIYEIVYQFYLINLNQLNIINLKKINENSFKDINEIMKENCLSNNFIYYTEDEFIEKFQPIFKTISAETLMPNSFSFKFNYEISDLKMILSNLILGENLNKVYQIISLIYFKNKILNKKPNLEISRINNLGKFCNSYLIYSICIENEENFRSYLNLSTDKNFICYNKNNDLNTNESVTITSFENVYEYLKLDILNSIKTHLDIEIDKINNETLKLLNMYNY